MKARAGRSAKRKRARKGPDGDEQRLSAAPSMLLDAAILLSLALAVFAAQGAEEAGDFKVLRARTARARRKLT